MAEVFASRSWMRIYERRLQTNEEIGVNVRRGPVDINRDQAIVGRFC